MAKYGNCVDCNFPILLQKENPVACPSCRTINQPISGAFAAAALPLIMAAGAFIIAWAKKAGKAAAAAAAEEAGEAAAKWGKGKVKEWRGK